MNQDERRARAERAAAAYLETYERRAADFEKSVEAVGLEFEPEESHPREERTGADIPGVHCENGGASLWRSWLSPACLACRRGVGSETFFVSLQCTRQCYFCFNPNQADYELYTHEKRDIAGELRERHRAGARYRCLAVTGGEPLLHPEEVLDFLRTARELYPEAHLRLYTNGDLLDDAMIDRLAEAGLDELRLSVKPFEIEEDRERLYERLAAAVPRIPAVMVEMPVIPGSLDEMKGVLVRLDQLGAKGINLLEFCFPLFNAEEFRRRGFKLRRRPYPVLYNFWYAGGLPVAGSERECMDLLRFAADEGLALGVHYCSLDNKHTTQLYQQNRWFDVWNGAAQYPWVTFDDNDLLLKSARAFGLEPAEARDLLGRVAAEEGAPEDATEPWEFDDRSDSVVFPLAWAARVHELAPHAVVLESRTMMEVPDPAEVGEDGIPAWILQEVDVEPLFA